MALTDGYSNFVALTQWLHLVPALMWIALTLFLPFGLLPLVKRQDHATQVVWHREIVRIVLTWTKWSSAATLILGTILFLQKYGWGNLWWDASGSLTDRGLWMILGITLSVLMAVNLWFGILPSSGEGGEKRERAEFLARLNAYLAGPTTLAMVAPNNYGAINLVTVAVGVALGLGAICALDWGVRKSSAS